MKRTVLALPLAFLALAPAGCVEDPETGTVSESIIVKGGGGGGEDCPATGCSSNSPYLGDLEFHELDETGVTPNFEGYKIKEFWKKDSNGVKRTYKLDVTGTRLTGLTYSIFLGRWVTALQNTGLVGAHITVEDTNPGGSTFDMWITNVGSQWFWQPPTGTIETYEFKARDLSYPSHYIPVCKNPPNRNDPEGQLWAAGTDAYEAILFTGDRYDRDALTVTHSTYAASGPWFNIGCFGNVMAKLALNRFTTATAVPGPPPPTQAQRQAMLKMYTSDLCDTGDAFTKQGTPLRWYVSSTLSSPTNAATPYPEAYWDEHGIVCMTTHRLRGTTDDMSSQYNPVCRPKFPGPGTTTAIPSCTGMAFPNGSSYVRTFEAQPPAP